MTDSYPGEIPFKVPRSKFKVQSLTRSFELESETLNVEPGTLNRDAEASPLRHLVFLPIADIQCRHGVNLGAIDHVLDADAAAHAARRVPFRGGFRFRRIDEMSAETRAIGDHRHAVSRDARAVAGDAVANRFRIGNRFTEYSLVRPRP